MGTECRSTTSTSASTTSAGSNANFAKRQIRGEFHRLRKTMGSPDNARRTPTIE